MYVKSSEALYLQQPPISGQAAEGRSESRPLLTLIRHAICVLALMWTGLVNGQPFFFYSDSTNYVRAGDAAFYKLSGGRLTTEWSDRYLKQLQEKTSSDDPTALGASTAQSAAAPSGMNNLGHGVIASGRSPYIGVLMYLGFVTGDFWPYILLQAGIAYGLILLTLKRFGVYSPGSATLLTLVLAATTSLPTYNSVLLADAFASFGILAYLLLATPGKLTRPQQAFLAVVLAISMVSHLTHMLMIAGAMLCLLVLRLMRAKPQISAKAWWVGAAALLVGVSSIEVTNLATRLAFGVQPQLIPLFTARFIADGPGYRFIKAGCDGNRFEICRVPIGTMTSDAAILFNRGPTGTFMNATFDQRLKMEREDVPFAFAVLKYDPAGQLAAIARNTARQIAFIDYDGLNQNCFDRITCWDTLPKSVGDKLRNSPSGRSAWPQPFMNGLLYAVVIASLLCLVALSRILARSNSSEWRMLRAWTAAGATAMLVCCILGGAIAEPQYRYQGRLIWLVVFAAGIAILLWRRGSGALSSELVEP